MEQWCRPVDEDQGAGRQYLGGAPAQLQIRPGVVLGARRSEHRGQRAHVVEDDVAREVAAAFEGGPVDHLPQADRVELAVPVGVERRPPGPAQERVEGRRPDVEGEQRVLGHGVHRAGQPGLEPVGGRNGDDAGALAGPVGDERAPGRQQHRGRQAAGALRDQGQRPGTPPRPEGELRQPHVDAGGAGFGEHRLGAGADDLLPVPERRPGLAESGGGRLVGREVERGEGRQRRKGLAGEQGEPLLPQDGEGAAVRHGVAGHHDGEDRGAGQCDEGDPERELLLQHEAFGAGPVGQRLGVRPGLRRELVEVEDRDGELALGRHHLLARCGSRAPGEGGAQRLVPYHQDAQGVDRRVQPDPGGRRPHVVDVDLRGVVPQDATDHVGLAHGDGAPALLTALVRDGDGVGVLGLQGVSLTRVRAAARRVGLRRWCCRWGRGAAGRAPAVGAGGAGPGQGGHLPVGGPSPLPARIRGSQASISRANSAMSLRASSRRASRRAARRSAAVV